MNASGAQSGPIPMNISASQIVTSGTLLTQQTHHMSAMPVIVVQMGVAVREVHATLVLAISLTRPVVDVQTIYAALHQATVMMLEHTASARTVETTSILTSTSSHQPRQTLAQPVLTPDAPQTIFAGGRKAVSVSTVNGMTTTR
jgi:hypothetical protein